jgi:hypothetical protein
MTLRPGPRRLLLTVHVLVTVGWVGAVAVFLAVGILAMTHGDEATVRGAYLVMDSAARTVLVPLAVASLLTGVVQGVGTPWGLVRHYWVAFKLVITVLATVVLLAYLETFDAMAQAAADPGSSLASVRSASPVVHAGLALVLLLTATVLAVYKPRGRTPVGRR